jgi:Tol biopolymer transport system component
MAEPASGSPGQVWFISYPQGEVRRLTNDLTNYGLASLAITQDAKTIATVENNVHEDLWVAPGGNSDRATQIPFNGEPMRINAVDTDRILIQDRHRKLFAVHLDGSGQTPLLNGRDIGWLTECGPSHTLVFSVLQDGQPDIWKADADGSNPLQLTHEKNARTPACTSDGKSFVYFNSPNLFIQSLTGNSPPVKLDATTADGGSIISPDNKTLATLTFVEGPPTRMAFSFAPLEGGKPHFLFEHVPASATWSLWSPDGKAIDYATLRKGAANVWRQPITGGPYQQITKFNTTVLSSFLWSRDAKNLYVIRGSLSSDIILLRDTK